MPSPGLTSPDLHDEGSDQLVVFKLHPTEHQSPMGALAPPCLHPLRPSAWSTWTLGLREGVIRQVDRSGLCPWSRPPGWLWALCRTAHLPASPGCWRVGCAMSSVLQSRDPSTCGRDTSALFFPQAGEKHYHPLCALCVRCGRMFAEGEEMYLQGEIKNVLLGPLGKKWTSLGPTPRAGCEPVGHVSSH